jgi:hypothetical protein
MAGSSATEKDVKDEGHTKQQDRELDEITQQRFAECLSGEKCKERCINAKSGQSECAQLGKAKLQYRFHDAQRCVQPRIRAQREFVGWNT